MSAPPLEITFKGVIDGEAKFDFHCTECRGWTLKTDNVKRVTPEAFCGGCGARFGTMAELQMWCADVAERHDISVSRRLDFLAGLD